MQHHPDERNQLEALHDRYKNFSLEVYDHHISGNHEKLKEAQKNLRETEIELNALKKKLHP
ncbi:MULTISPECIES: hypothetical protein [unclassified Algibacter]|uniref:hypothetical protein n=1 Tax=unclassified Algibacter TaxID=2615009 RepID=UPI00131E3D0F|nr:MULTISPECIES: hypothetical protein [unclassified Algibacter]MCL5130298.1 hypothetical protein [Algibacter sp. L4_22]